LNLTSQTTKDIEKEIAKNTASYEVNVCFYTYMDVNCIYEYMYIYVHVYTYTHIYIYVYMYTYMYIHISIFMYLYIQEKQKSEFTPPVVSTVVKKKVVKIVNVPLQPFQVMRFSRVLAIIILGYVYICVYI
jgi:hypothetical protein